ncbi:MAG: transcriptional regulator [Chthoniobacteraceae bacterium]|jgi:DNA-binding HxlR family transcriptional regulator
MFDFEKLDKTIHEKGRLGIMTLLATRPSWSFQDLKSELNMSDGNLVSHLRTLHDAGLVSVTKEIIDRPQTSYGLTAKGRTAFREYLAVLEQIVNAGKSRP